MTRLKPPGGTNQPDADATSSNVAGLTYGLVEIAGHSYTRDAGVDGSEARSPWQMMLAQSIGGARVINYGRGSAQTHDPSIGYGSFMENCLRPRLAGPDLPYCGLGVVMYGLNEIGIVPDATLFRNYLRMVVAMLRASRLFANSTFTHSHGSNVTPSAGTWGSIGAPYNGGPFREITTVGATSTLALGTTYDGAGVFLLFPAGPTDVFSGTITVTTSGVVRPAHSPDGQDDGTFTVDGSEMCGPTTFGGSAANGMYCKRITSRSDQTALQAGDIITVTYTAITGTARINGWGIEADPVPSVVIANVARVTLPGATGYTESDARVATWNAVLPDVVAEFDDYVTVADIDTALAKSHFADGRHADDRGQPRIASAIRAALPSRTTADAMVLARGTNPDVVAGITLGANITGGGGSTNAPWCRVSRAGTVMLGGRLTTTGSLSAGATIATVPIGARPYYSEYFTVSDMTSPGAVIKVRVDGTAAVSTGASVAGRVQVVNAVGSGVTFNLGGVVYQAER